MNFDALVDNMKQEIVDSVCQILKYRSVQSSPLPGAPFGQGVKEALDYIIDLSDKMGLKTNNLNGYAGYAEYGNGNDMIGILVHLDVVPEGENWTYPPFGGEIHNDKVYGRGAIDDKGPAIAALYALKAVKESGLPINRRVRIIFGTNEETGWGGINYYKEHEEHPQMGFVPDANFPLIFAEKGILEFQLKQNLTEIRDGDIKLKYLRGGDAVNVVPDYCEAGLHIAHGKKDYIRMVVAKLISENKVNIKIFDEGEDLILKSYGKSAHGSMPEKGLNAIIQLLLLLYRLDFNHDDIYHFMSFFVEKVGPDTYGKGMGLNISDDISGNLSFNLGAMFISDNEAIAKIDIRYPVTYKKDDIVSKVKANLNGKMTYEYLNGHDPLYLSKNSVLIQKLMDVYRDFTGDTGGEPISIGGGTYARAFDNFVAFGPIFPGGVELAHQRDEYVEIPHLIKLVKIYSQAIYELCNI